MRAVRWTSIAGVLATAAVVTPVSAGLGPLQRDLGGFTLRWTSGPWVSGDGDRLGHKKPPADPRERYLEFAAKSRGLGYGYLPFARALWAPFRWETTVGLPATDRKDGLADATFGTQLVTDGDSSSNWSFDAKLTSTGIDVAANPDLGAPLGAKSYAAATAVDLAIEHDGATLSFYARAEGTGAYELVGSTADTQTKALFPVLSVFAGKSPALVGFDRFRVASSAEAPDAAASNARTGIERLYDAFDVHLDALHALDGAASTNDSIVASLATADTSLGLAIDSFTGSARKKALAARKAAAAASKALSTGKPRETAAKSLRKALDLELSARNAAAK